MNWISIKKEKPTIENCGRDFLVKIKISTGYEYQVAEWWNPDTGDEPYFLIENSWCGQQMLTKEITHWLDFEKMDNSEWIVAYQTFLIEGVNEMLKAERSIVKDGFVKISIDEECKCIDSDLAKYKIEYKYPLHLIHLGQDLHRANLKLSDDLKRKWYVR